MDLSREDKDLDVVSDMLNKGEDVDIFNLDFQKALDIQKCIILFYVYFFYLVL